MNVISVTAETFGWLLQKTSMGLHVFLEANYFTVAYLIHIIGTVANICGEIALSIFILLRCYYFDFLTFSNELAIGLHLIFVAVINFFTDCFNLLFLLYCTIVDILNSLYVSILSISNAVVYILSEAIEKIIYFIELIFEAFLLILQLGPNILIFLYGCFIYCCIQLWNSLQCSFYFLWENLYQLPSECLKMANNIPLKAYFGSFMLGIIIYYRKSIKRYIRTFFKHSLKFAIFISQFIHKIITYILCTLMIMISHCINYVSYILPLKWTNSASRRNSRNSRNGNILAYRYMKTTLHILSLPFRKIKEELNEEQIKLLQRELCEEKMRRACIICHDRERNVLLYPCRHMIMCEECTISLQASYRDCPLCRKEILNTLVVYT